ncbi:MAG: hypothetical protein HKM93_20530 [Desulfobacteraceae bacterium]|nr:hypothetical protein [Desulfobacteraceae bacterium]
MLKSNDAAGGRSLTPEQNNEVNRLKKIDQKVKSHEQAHMAAGADLVSGGASFTFVKGPDGKNYAVGGEVKIDTSAENDPDQTIRKMQQVKRAALAPAEPSSTDRSVAAKASQVEARARMEKSRQTDDQVPASEENRTGIHGYDMSANPITSPPEEPAPVGLRINISI